MITATIKITITQFRPMGGVFPVSADMALIKPVPQVKLRDGCIIITGGKPVKLVFTQPDPRFVFVGAAFDASTPDTDVGADEFPTLLINRNPKKNSLTVTDANRPEDAGKSYAYVLLVQNTATGEIGVIDPPIINEPS